MHSTKARNVITIVLLLSKFIVIIWLIILWLSFTYTFDQAFELMVIVIPLFSIHLTAIFKYYFGFKTNKTLTNQDSTVSTMQAFLSLFIPISYLIFMVFIISLSLDKISFANLKMLVGLGESLFGVYLGIIIADMFSK